MNKQKISLVAIFAIVAIVIAVTGSLYFDFDSPNSVEPEKMSSFEITYGEANSNLKQALEKNNVTMSSPIKLDTKTAISKYCNFFEDSEKQELIHYCTSTELKTKNNSFLGNIHMVGLKPNPSLIITMIQLDNSMNEHDKVKTIFGIVIDNIVCDCWKQEKPDDFENVGEWVEAMGEFHTSGDGHTSKSKILPLGDNYIQMELTTTNDGRLWKLFVTP